MKVRIPFITKDELKDGKRDFDYEWRDVELDCTMYCQIRWETTFPEQAKAESLVDYATRFKELKENTLPILISKLKVLFCCMELGVSFQQFLKMFDFTKKEYQERLISAIKTAFDAVLDGAAEKN